MAFSIMKLHFISLFLTLMLHFLPYCHSVAFSTSMQHFLIYWHFRAQCCIFYLDVTVLHFLVWFIKLKNAKRHQCRITSYKTLFYIDGIFYCEFELHDPFKMQLSQILFSSKMTRTAILMACQGMELVKSVLWPLFLRWEDLVVLS